MNTRGGGRDWIARTSDRGRSSARLMGELTIIFVGVFGAFVAEDVRQKREDAQRAQQTYDALSGEVQTFAERAPFVVGEIDERITTWETSRAGGALSPPPFYREPRAETPPTAIWEATLASGAVALLEPELFNQLAVFYNRLISVSDRYRRYNGFTESDVLPHLGGDLTVFYRSGELGGRYRAHVDLLVEVRDEIEQLTAEAEALHAQLLEALDG